MLYALFILGFISLAVSGAGDRFKQMLLPSSISTSFIKDTKGFIYAEQWLNDKIAITEKPFHYHSFNHWIKSQAEKINNAKEYIIVYDPRLSWFGMNWYQYRYSLYSSEVPFLHASFFIYLLANQSIEFTNQKIIYIRADNRARDVKAGFDSHSSVFDNIMILLKEKQNIEPIIIKNHENKNFVQIWEVEWDKNINVQANSQ